MRRFDVGFLTGVFAVMAFAVPASALVVTEDVDAGVTMDTAFALPDGTTSIEGTIVNTDISDVDLFSFALDTAATLTIRMLFPTHDANLMLFNSLGQGLAGSDDVNADCANSAGLSGLDSCLTMSLAAGDYYLAAGDNNIGAYASEADWIEDEAFFTNDSGILAEPTSAHLGLVQGQKGPGTLNDEGPYTIEFSSPVSAGPSAGPSAVPLPGALPLMAAGLGAFAVLKRRRRA